MIVELESAPGYGVDRDGRVYSRRLSTGKLDKQWREKKQCCLGKYLGVTLRGKSKATHRLVAEAFHGPCPQGKEVEHVNGDRFDNRAENLRYVTHVQNEASKRRHGTDPSGERNGNAKLNEQQVREIRRRPARYGAVKRLAEEFGVTGQMIYLIRSRKNWKEVAP